MTDQRAASRVKIVARKLGLDPADVAPGRV